MIAYGASFSSKDHNPDDHNDDNDDADHDSNDREHDRCNSHATSRLRRIFSLVLCHHYAP